MTKPLVLAALLLPLSAAAQDQWDARVHSASGDVTIYTAEEPEGAPAHEGIPLQDGDRIETGEDGKAELSFDGEGIVTVDPDTDVQVSSLHHGKTELMLKAGALVSKLKTLLQGRRFAVRTPTAVAAVRGTEFGVEVDGEDTHVGVFDEGQVAVADEQGREELVPANHETHVRRGQAPLRAYAHKRFAQRRAILRAMRRRHAALGQRWRALPPEQRLELRKKAHERMKQRRKAWLERRRQRLQRGGERMRNRRQRRLDRRRQ